jgi:hypothetical protein
MLRISRLLGSHKATKLLAYLRQVNRQAGTTGLANPPVGGFHVSCLTPHALVNFNIIIYIYNFIIFNPS